MVKLLVSQLADHTKNLQADGRVSLLFDATAGLAEPLTGPRVTVHDRPNAVGRSVRGSVVDEDDFEIRRQLRRRRDRSGPEFLDVLLGTIQRRDDAQEGRRPASTTVGWDSECAAHFRTMN